MADREVTFEFAKNNWYQFSKQPIPNSLECMTKADINAYLKADMDILSEYAENQLVPTAKFKPKVVFPNLYMVKDIIPTNSYTGNIYVGGWFNKRLYELTYIGEQVITYDSNIINYVNSISAQGASGKIIIGTSGTGNNRVQRVNANGSLDETFLINNAVFNFSVECVQSTLSNILVVGGFSTFSGNPYGRIIKFTPEGVIDDTFNSGGTGFNATAYKVIDNLEGKIYVAGAMSTYNGNYCNKVVRLNTDGSVDTTFNIPVTLAGTIYSMVLYTDGKIIVAGSTNDLYNSKAILLINQDGSIDETFNSPYIKPTALWYFEGYYYVAEITTVSPRITTIYKTNVISGEVDETFICVVEGTVSVIRQYFGIGFYLGGVFTSVNGETADNFFIYYPTFAN